VSSSVQAVMAQRLVRTLCMPCRRRVPPDEAALAALGVAPEALAGRTLYESEGCPKCDYTGFRGRTGIFELMEMDATLREMTFRKEPTARIRSQAVRSGLMVPLTLDGGRKVLEGRTSLREILKAVKTSSED